MFAVPGVILLVLLLYTRPQEFVDALRGVPLLYVCLGVAFAGYAIDLRLRRSRLQPAPQLVPAVIFILWAMFSVATRSLDALIVPGLDVTISVMFFIVLAHTVQTFRVFQVVAGTLLVIALFLAAVGVHQGLQPLTCHRLDPDSVGEIGTPDGRPCHMPSECEGEGAEPGADYMCEKPGLFGTSSIGGGRVRYRGSLNDPNALALTIAASLPFAFAFYQRRRTTARLLLLLFSAGLIGLCTVFTQSRGGQLVVLVVLGVYCVQRYGIKGVVLGALAAAPILLLGGREGAEASSEQRLEDLYAAMSLFLQYPLRGIGMAQILEYHSQTAHNSYALAAAELGFPGLVVWTTVLYLSVRTPIAAFVRYADRPEAAAARIWAVALSATMAGMSVGIFFLSFTYHQMFWVFVGLSGAFYSACKAHDPEFRVPFGWSQLGRLIVFDGMLASIMYLYARRKTGGG